MPRGSTFEYNVVAALIADSSKSYYSIDQIIEQIERDGEFLEDRKSRKLPTIELEIQKEIGVINPEEEMLLRDMFDKLSAESREILFILTARPETLDEELYTPTRKIFSHKKFLKYLKKRKFEVDEVMRELKEFTDLYFEIKK